MDLRHGAQTRLGSSHTRAVQNTRGLVRGAGDLFSSELELELRADKWSAEVNPV